MGTPAENLAIAERWLATFAARDLDGLLALYAPDARHSSPKIRVAHPETGGHIEGHATLRAWWQGAFERLPGLVYEKQRLTADSDCVFMEYLRRVPGEADMPIAEVLEVRGGLIVASRVFHG